MKSVTKKLFGLVLAGTLALTGLWIAPDRVPAGEAVSYIYYEDEASAIAGTASVGTCTEYTLVESGSTAWSNGWYVVNTGTSIDTRITVTGTVNLILCDGATLTAEKGITVADNDQDPVTPSSNILNIYGQSLGTGTLIATSTDLYNAAIGGFRNNAGNDRERDCGRITINGGAITASGGRYGAGIGAAPQSTCGDISFTGGTVVAYAGENASGIGKGYTISATPCGDIRFTGGDITAYGGVSAATHYIYFNDQSQGNSISTSPFHYPVQ